MWTACILAAVGTPFCIVKLIMFHYARNPLPAVALLSANMGFTVRNSQPLRERVCLSSQLHRI